ncbi:MAG: formylglycine-generating enzyme family protein [Bacteroidota bacterium]
MKKIVLLFVACLAAANLSAQTKPTIEWANIPAGTFSMGSDISEVARRDNEVQHQVTINAFKMSKYEVTFEQYDAFCVATKRNKPSDAGWGRGKRPVINVSWFDAKAFADWMGCRLPTEAEWEYACRAETKTPFNTGGNILTTQSNFDGNFPYIGDVKGEYRQKTLPVGSFAPNAWGLYDMHGNAWEWCSDWYVDYKTTAENNPKGPETGTYRVFRGGSWINYARLCRSAIRNYDAPAYRHMYLGFRLVSVE